MWCLVSEEGSSRGGSRIEYIKLSLERKKVEIGKYASKNGVAKAVRHYEDLYLTDSSMRDRRDVT